MNAHLRPGEEPFKMLAEQFGGGCEAQYTLAEIQLRMCSRKGCPRMAHASWAGCADENINRPLCPECDIELNRLAMEWWGDPEWEEKITKYANEVEEEIGRKVDIPWLERA